MLKNNAIKRIVISTLALLVLIIVYLFPVKQNDTTIKINYVDAIKMPIYLVDKNNYVARINILKSSDNIDNNIKSIISSLTENSKESTYLPEGFKSVLPENTKLLTHDLKDGVLKLNFSEEFLNMDGNNEEKAIEALIFSLCELKEVTEIMIFIDGKKLTELPNSKKTLPLTLNKNFGINKNYDITSFKNINQTITYYISKNEELSYYVPITKYENNNIEKIEVIIKNLQTSPVNQTNLISYLKASASLETYEILEESINISFDNSLIADLSDKEILEEVKYSIYLSMRDTYNVKSVIFDIPDEQNVSVLLD